MKKIITLLSMLSLVISLCCVSAFAAGTSKIEYKASDLEVNPGDTITVDVEFSGFANAKAYIIRANFDSNSIKLKNDPEPLYTHFFFKFDPEYVEFMAGFSEGTALNQDFVRYTFVVSDTVKPGSTITISFTTEMQFEGGATLDTSIPQNPVVLTVVCPHTNKTKTEANAATCTAEGNNAYYTCTDCGAILKADGKTVTTVEAERLEMLEHTYVKHDKVGPTHTKEGMDEYYTCSVCSKIFDSAKKEVANTDGFKLGVIPHTFGEEWKSDETGHWHVCECGEKTIAEEHTPKEVIDTKPDEDKAGVGHDECEVCGYVTNEGKVIPPLKHEHTMEKVDAKDATCAEEGNIEHYTCTKCHKNFSDEAGKNELASVSTPKNPENHTGETKTEVGKKKPTCGDKGYTGDTICAGCEAVLEKGTDIEPTGEHKNTEVRGDKKADCIHEGYTGDTYCLDCKTKIETGTKLDPTGIHDFEWVTVEQATIDKTGLELQVCTVCNEEGESRVIPPIDCFHEHMEYHEKVAATCINTGTCKYWHCPDCGKNYSDEKGEREIKDLVLDKDPNNHVNTELRNVKSATCSAEGYTGDKYCSDCNKLIENGSTIPVDSNAHKYVNNRCEYCGKQLVIYPSGYIYVNNEYHISGPVLARHIPDSMTMHTDGVYEWRCCAYCHHEYDKVAVVDINVGDSVDLIVDDPVQSGDDEPIPDVPVTEPEPTEPAEPVEDNNPPTGVAIAVLPMVLAAAAAISSKKMNK